jgi:catechol 2,3-dioxygenase-like lactoylglutathione lyase family enzyme
MTEINGIEHVNLTVRDVVKTAGWYADLLGLEKVWEEDTGDPGWHKIGLYHAECGLRLNFTQHRPGVGDSFSEFRTGLDHLAFQVTGGFSALDVWLRRLDERGIARSEIKHAVNGQVITVRDPDNIQIEIYALPE